MKIVSFNIGNFIWITYTDGAPHYAFQTKDIDAVTSLIKNEDADIIFLQEIASDADAELLCQYFLDLPYSFKIKTSAYATSLFLSKFPIKEIHHTQSNDYEINGITFFPIHLYAFSPKVRLEQTKLLLSDVPEKRGVILGDTNFWIYNSFFFSKHDKSSYDMITRNYKDCLSHLGETHRTRLSLDKIFITPDLHASKVKIVKHKIGSIDHYLISAILSPV